MCVDSRSSVPDAHRDGHVRVLECEPGGRLLPLGSVHDGFEIVQDCIGVSYCVSLKGILSLFFRFCVAKSQSPYSLLFGGLLCGAVSICKQFRENGLCRTYFFLIVRTIWGSRARTNRYIGRPFLSQGGTRPQQPFHPTLAAVAAQRVMDVNFAQWVAHNRLREAVCLWKKGLSKFVSGTSTFLAAQSIKVSLLKQEILWCVGSCFLLSDSVTFKKFG